MPLDILGSYAASGSSGANARNAARSTDTSSAATAGFAARAVSPEATDAPEVEISTDGALAVYVSPFIRFDVKTRLAIVEIRNSQTGEVQQQYPSPRAVREYAQNLPEDSDLRTESDESAKQQSLQPRIIGSAADNASEAAKKPSVSFGKGNAAPTASASNGQAPAGSREVAIA